MEAKFQEVELKLKKSIHSERTINNPEEESHRVKKKSLTEVEEVQNLD